VSLTEKQEQKLIANRRTELPTYYDSADDSTYYISSSTEDAMILLSSTTKKRCVDYIKQFLTVNPSQRQTDYNSLLYEVTSQQVENSNAIAAELALITGKFNEFLASFSGQLDDTEVTIHAGMQPIMSAMTRKLGRLIDIDQNENFHRLYDEAMKFQYAQSTDAGLKQELRSWIRVLVSYP
jgi:hypothetical protein